jgi:Uma2 family endonuclease
MAMASPQTRWTAAMVRALPEDGFRHEVIDGEHVVTPAPSWTHQRAVRELVARLLPYLAERQIGELLFAPADVEFDEHNMVEPDLFVVPLGEGRRPQSWQDIRALLLVVEVLSPSTNRRDRVSKRQLYQRQDVAEYWIVEADMRRIERWRAAEEVGTILTDRLGWQPKPGAPPLSIDLGAFFHDVTGED